MEPLDIGVDSTVNDGPSDPKVADVRNSLEHHVSSLTNTPANTSMDEIRPSYDAVLHKDEKVPGSQAPASALPAPDANSTIINLYLTFDTALPAPNTQDKLTNEHVPPCPDLSRYTNPLKWPNSRKNVMLFLSCVATALTAYAAGSYSPPAELMAAEFGVSRVAVLVGITTFTAGFAFAPMVLAPFSEINGRYPVFVVAGILFVVFQAVCGLVPNLAGILVARFVTGVGSSVFSTMVGGVIADLWVKEERNTPMALFSGAVLIGTGLGPLDSSVMVHRFGGDGGTGPSAAWRWIFWHQVIADTILIAAVVIWFHESRGSVLLSRRAKKMNQWYEALEEKGVFGVWVHDGFTGHYDTVLSAAQPHSGNEEKGLSGQSTSSAQDRTEKGFKLQRIRWLVKQDEQRTSITKMISVSLFRPFHLLFTEPVVFFFSLWVSFAWAILYLTFGSIPLVFARQYDFNAEQSGYVFLAMIVGAILATIIGIYQEKLLKHAKWQRKVGSADEDPADKFWSFMRRRVPVEAPESRLYFTCLTSILLPLGLYLFGFSAQPAIHWIVPAMAICFASMGIYFIYLATFNYLADSYHEYASSALAAQSFCRNILGGTFPLVVNPLFTNLGEWGAGGLLGAIATALTVVPWVLAFFGERIRRKSRFAVALE